MIIKRIVRGDSEKGTALYKNYYIKEIKGSKKQYALCYEPDPSLRGSFKTARQAFQYIRNLSHHPTNDIRTCVEAEPLHDKENQIFAVVDVNRENIIWADFVEKKLWQVPIEDQMLSEPFDSFIECLDFAKRYLIDLERKHVREFDIGVNP